MHVYYRVYGLQLKANLEIPGLKSCEPVKEAVDVDVTMGRFPEKIVHLINQEASPYYLEPGFEEKEPPHVVVTILSGGKYYYFNYDGTAQFVCDRQATVVWGNWQEPFVLEDAALYLLGPILGFMLRLRGVTCLHASSVVVDGGALAITGQSGTGKSTLASALAAEGYPVLTDDILPLMFDQGHVYALPGYPRIRLYPNTFQNIPDLPDDLPLLTPNWDKCFLDLDSGFYSFVNEPVPLRGVYLLDWSDDNTAVPEICPVKSTAAVPLLAANTYHNELLDMEMKKQEFYFLSRLVSYSFLRKVKPVDDIAELHKLVEIIFNDFIE